MLRLHPANAGGASSIPGQGIKIPHAVWHGQKKKKGDLNKNWTSVKNSTLILAY